MAKTFVVALIFFVHLRRNDAAINNFTSAFDPYMNAYYNPVTGNALTGEIEESGRFPFSKIGFRGLPCTCENLSCGCCAGINITTFNLDQETCTKFTYDPLDFEIRMDVDMNKRNVFSTKISAKNPPPLCMPMPYIPAITFCARLFDIHMPENRMHACMDFETKIIQATILVLHFDCVRIGGDGIAWVKPQGNNDASQPTIAGPEIYDAVDFEMNDSPISGSNDNGSTLSPEDEDKIGQLKL